MRIVVYFRSIMQVDSWRSQNAEVTRCIHLWLFAILLTNCTLRLIFCLLLYPGFEHNSVCSPYTQCLVFTNNREHGFSLRLTQKNSPIMQISIEQLIWLRAPCVHANIFLWACDHINWIFTLSRYCIWTRSFNVQNAYYWKHIYIC